MKVKVAAAQYNIDFLRFWKIYQNKIERWVDEAARQNARILLFPEYASMELASLFPRDIYSSLSKQLEAMQSVLDDYIALYQSLARYYGCYIQSGTFPVRMPDGDYRNRAYFFMPVWAFRLSGQADDDPF